MEKRLVFAADIREAVQSDASLEPAVHAAAVNLARLIEDSPRRLSSRAKRIVNDENRSQADYEQAQRAAALAFQSDPTSLTFARNLAKALTRLHHLDKAIAVWREHVNTRRAATPANDLGLTNSLIEYGKALLKNDRAKNAEPVLRECLSIREKAPKKNDSWIAEARGVLGECLTRLAQFTEAEPLVIESANVVLEKLTRRTNASDTAEAIQRVVGLYEAWNAAEPGKGYDAKAAEWRARLPAKEEEQADDADRSGSD